MFLEEGVVCHLNFLPHTLNDIETPDIAQDVERVILGDRIAESPNYYKVSIRVPQGTVARSFEGMLVVSFHSLNSDLGIRQVGVK